jgi:O-acetylhomoserine/O-acetylserine sulfhydrylase-like pyridoxal-dependent enzyme
MQEELDLSHKKTKFSMLVEEKIDNFILANHKKLYEKSLGSVYVLLLEKNKLYVGFSEDINVRIKKHFRYKAKTASWLKHYPPIELITTVVGCDKGWENLLTKYLMIEFGVNNVRGGGYTSNRVYNNQPISLDNFSLQ